MKMWLGFDFVLKMLCLSVHKKKDVVSKFWLKFKRSTKEQHLRYCI